MAEDPGVGTLSAVIEAMRQLFNFVQDTAKSIVNTGADIARTYLYMSWRKNSMGARAKHGEQSLKKLRRQEAQGATIKTVEIGKDFEAMLALEDELKNLKVDFAITQTSTGEWLLHYKQSNEPDVIRAQQYALNSRYGAHEQSEPWQGPERINDENRSDPLQQDSAWVDVRQERAAREQQEQATQQQQQQTGQSRQNEPRSHDQDALKATAASTAYIQPEGALHEHGRTEQAASIDKAKTERATSRTPKAQSATVRPSMEALRRASAERAGMFSRSPVTAARGERAHAEPSIAQSQPSQARAKAASRTVAEHQPLDSIKKEARERAAMKNRARNKNKDRARDRMQERKARSRMRAYELGR